MWAIISAIAKLIDLSTFFVQWVRAFFQKREAVKREEKAIETHEAFDKLSASKHGTKGEEDALKDLARVLNRP